MTGEYYCDSCFSRDLYKCPDCGKMVSSLEEDCSCESCSPDDYWRKEDPDWDDSYDPDYSNKDD